MVLRDSETGAIARIDHFSTIWREGCNVFVGVSSYGLIDFAGFGWNGIYEFTCLDEADAVAIVDGWGTATSSLESIALPGPEGLRSR